MEDNDLVRELKLEIEARETIGDTKRVKSQRTPKDTVEGLLSVDKITCLFCQQDHFADRCNIVTNVNTRKKNATMSVEMLHLHKERVPLKKLLKQENMFSMQRTTSY